MLVERYQKGVIRNVSQTKAALVAMLGESMANALASQGAAHNQEDEMVQNFRVFRAASHINTNDLVALRPDGTVERARNVTDSFGSADSVLGMSLGEATPGSVVPIGLDGAPSKLHASAFRAIKTGEGVCAVQTGWVTSAQNREPGTPIVGVAETDAADGADVVVTFFAGRDRLDLKQRAAPDDTTKSEIAYAYWKRALAPDYIVHQKQLLPQLIEAMARDEVDAVEGAAILSRYGYAVTVEVARAVSARFVIDALVVTTKSGNQIRLDRDLDLLRTGGEDSPMRQLIEGRAGHLTKEADDAFGESEELLK